MPLLLRAARYDRFRFINVAVARLEFGFETDFEMGKIDKVPAGELPSAGSPWFMLEADQEVDRVVAHLVGRDLRLEIERAETAVAAAGCVQLRIEVEDAVSRRFDEPQVGIPGALDVAFCSARKIATESWRAVEQFAKKIFEVTAGFIDSSKALDRTVRHVHAPHYFIQDNANILQDVLVGFILRVDRQQLLARGVGNDLAER